MSAEAAEAAKAAGNNYFKAKDYDNAIKSFTEAIEVDSTNHTLYSNRSAAYASQGSFKEALADANKCIALNGSWARGHSRRAAAYVGLKNYIQAQAALEKAAELDPSSQFVAEELRKVKEWRNGGSARAAAAAAAYGGSASYGGSTGPTPVTSGIVPTLSLSALLCGLLYAVPLIGAARAQGMYLLSLGNILLMFVVNLWNTFPKKLATLTDPKFQAAQEYQAFMLVLFLLFSPPVPFALMPFLSTCFLNVVHTYAGALSKLPSFLSSKLEYFRTAEGLFQVHAFGAVSEVIVTFMMPLLVVVQGYRALLLWFFYFQYLVRRHRTNPTTVQTVQMLMQKLDGIAHHRFAPAILQTLYTRAKSLVSLAAEKLVR